MFCEVITVDVQVLIFVGLFPKHSCVDGIVFCDQ